MPKPQTKEEVKRKFVQNLSEISAPLQDLLKGMAFQWELERKQAFVNLKRLCDAIQCDASQS
jgi:hypothetical protein